MCQIDQHEGTVGFVAIRRVLREFFCEKTMGDAFDPPPTSARVKLRVPMVPFILVRNVLKYAFVL